MPYLPQIYIYTLHTLVTLFTCVGAKYQKSLLPNVNSVSHVLFYLRVHSCPEQKELNDKLDIVSFAVPHPPVYGGVIDVFYRLKALAQLGVRIHLHAFTYADSQPSDTLLEYCETVHYYERSRSLLALRHGTPFIQATRNSDELIQALTGHAGPVLFEGLHTCGILQDPRLDQRPGYVRMHNIEWQYYSGLGAAAAPGIWRWYYKRESGKLKKHEQVALRKAKAIFAISRSDTDYFARLNFDARFLPAFHPYQAVSVNTGRGEYVLYQGDLSLRDNASAALTIAQVCQDLGFPCVIAGRRPSASAIRKLERFENTTLRFDVSNDEMLDLMHRAHVHVVESGIAAGFKIKLIASLFTGRFVVARNTLLDAGLEPVIHSFGSDDELRSRLRYVVEKDATEEDIALRNQVLLPRFSNSANAELLWNAMNNKA